MTEPEIVFMPERMIAGTVAAYTMSTRQEIPGQWQAFFEAGYSIANVREGAMYGVSFGADGQGGFRYAVGVEVDPVPATLPDGLCTVGLGEGLYARSCHFGPVSDLPANFDRLFTIWLPASRYTLREGAVFERYPEDTRNGPDGMAYEICIPVAAKPG